MGRPRINKGPHPEELVTPKMLREAFAYDPDTGVITWLVNRSKYSIGDKAFTNVLSNGYLRGGYLGCYFLASRVAWAIHYGEWPKNEIDHDDRVRTNNRIKNLRDVTRSQNMFNVKTRSKTGVTGVYKLGRGHCAYYSTKYLGMFDHFEEAVEARRKAENEAQ